MTEGNRETMTQEQSTKTVPVEHETAVVDPHQHERVEHVDRAEALGNAEGRERHGDVHFDEVTDAITAPGTVERGEQATGDDNQDGRDESQTQGADPDTDDMRGPATGR